MNIDVYEGYRRNAEELIKRFEEISSADVLAPVIPFLGNLPARVIDIGAGTGRDAAWLAALGYSVVAVEPGDAKPPAAARLVWAPDHVGPPRTRRLEPTVL
jgi:predicted RNA methylase